MQDLRKRLVSCSLLLSLMLTGCVDKETYVGNSLVRYEDGKAIGTVSYEDIENNIRIVTFSRENEVFTKPVIIRIENFNGVQIIKYINMENGYSLIEMSRSSKEVHYALGEDLEILEEKDFVSYLDKKEEYNMSDLVNFYQEEVEPTLEDNGVILN